MAAFLAGCFVVMDPLRKPVEEIRGQLLREKPLGTSSVEIERWLIVDKKLAPKRANTGYFTNRGVTVGFSSISAGLGEYKTFSLLAASVEAFWGFDEHGFLIDVWVRKSVDAP